MLAEKPSVARDIARVLGASQQGKGYLHGNGYVVTWAIGHLAALAQPHEINPNWRHWRRNLLPMLPVEWRLTVYEKTKDQFDVVQKILNSPKVSQVVCATDAGREGELIFRYIYEAAHCAKPFRRLWISSLTPDAIRRGFEQLRPGQEYDPLADAARGRSRADWLVGMNLSRAYSLAYGEKDFSVGRVQAPTLAMLVERELAIRKFVSEDYIEVLATFHPGDAPKGSTYQGTWFRERPLQSDQESLQKSMRLPADSEEANRIVERARTGQGAIESIVAQTQRMPPPTLYDLTELQRHANRLFGFSAQMTLDTAQALYERHKLISYPRTDSRHLSQDVAGTLLNVVHSIAESYREHLAPGTGERPLGRRFVDDSKVTDHHAIIPTTTVPQRASLTPEEQKIYDLICRRLLSAWHEDHIWQVTTVITAIRHPGVADRYHTSGSAVVQVGWKVLDLELPARARQSKPDTEANRDQHALPPGLAQDQSQDVIDAEVLKRKTRPPKRFTEATLLTAMETAGKTLDEKELSDAMKETGLGTPATRAAIIEVLLKREYIVRGGKSLEATDKGMRLIEVVHPEVKSPVMTGQWEAYLHRIQKGSAQLGPFIKAIEDYVREVVEKVGHVEASGTNTEPRASGGGLPPNVLSPSSCATDATPAELLHQAFGFSAFRANQEAVCKTVIQGRDVLLVMPTGAGKSLCYQLPGIARGGTTLVISPLIALMEDQLRQLKDRGVAVERIHSGRDRAAARQACADYLNGSLQFLFIAGTAPGGGLSRNAGEAQAQPHRHRRSPLHFAMGPRFPAGLSHARPVPANPAAGAGNRAHGHRDAAGARRYCCAVGPFAGGAFHPRVPSRQPRHRSGGGRAAAAGRTDGGIAAGSRAPPGHRVRPHASAEHWPRGRVGGQVSLCRLPRRPGCRHSQTRPGGVPGWPPGSNGGHDRVRHGHRQAERPYCYSYSAAGQS